jgi:hypothetical protein
MKSGMLANSQCYSDAKNGRRILLYSLETHREQQTTLLRVVAVELTSCAEIGIGHWYFWDCCDCCDSWNSWESRSRLFETAPNALCEWFVALHGDVSMLSKMFVDGVGDVPRRNSEVEEEKYVSVS